MSCVGDVADVQYHGATSRWQVRLESGEVFAPRPCREADIDRASSASARACGSNGRAAMPCALTTAESP